MPRNKSSDLWHGVVKVQVALAGEPGLLVYNKDRDVFAELDLPSPSVMKKFSEMRETFNRKAGQDCGSDAKWYMMARLDADGLLHLLDMVNVQGW